jgi:hypothetical protein
MFLIIGPKSRGTVLLTRQRYGFTINARITSTQSAHCIGVPQATMANTQITLSQTVLYRVAVVNYTWEGMMQECEAMTSQRKGRML